MINIKPENCSKKLDSLGRITFPKGLRDRFFLTNGDELELYTMDYEDRSYILLTPSGSEEVRKANMAKEILEEFGLEIPIGLQEIIENDV